MKRRVFLIGLLIPAAAYAHSFTQGDIAIGHAWALPSSGGDAQVFMPLVNLGKERDALVAARSDICSAIEIRQNNRYDDPPLASLPLEPAKPLPMRPTARHLRLIGLKGPLKSGDRFSLILDFLNAGEIEITVVVESAPRE
jgi:copper(I)-binding protein